METTYQEIKRIEARIAKYTQDLKQSREKLKDKKKILHDQLVARKRDEYHEFTVESLRPKPKTNPKALREEKEASIRGLLHTSGVTDPSTVLQQIKEIQRPPRKPKK